METINENVQKANVPKVPIPNSQGVLISGIFSLVVTFCCLGVVGVVGLALGIVALVMSTKAQEVYRQNPRAYTEASFKNVNAGRVCGIIGIVINGVIILFGLIYLIVAGAALTAFFSNFPWEDYI